MYFILGFFFTTLQLCTVGINFDVKLQPGAWLERQLSKWTKTITGQYTVGALILVWHVLVWPYFLTKALFSREH
jgi:hypothetical protein